MMDKKNEVMNHYDSNPQFEWERLDRHPFEWAITLRFMERYIKAGDTILDVSGGPGKYSIYFSKKGCDVTLVDLSPQNVEFAKQKAIEENVKIKAYQGDACFVDKIVTEQYDHVFLMGALYHLQEESDRIRAVDACLKLLGPDGVFYASFISNVAGIQYALRDDNSYIYNNTRDGDLRYIECFLKDEDFTGLGFTYSHMVAPKNILPFFEQFDLEKLHYFGQEGIANQAEKSILEQPQEVINAWIELAYKTCERDDLLSHAAHLMYIGRKIKRDENKKPLLTERLILRNFTIDDAQDVYEYAKNPNVGPNAGWAPHDSIEKSKEIINRFIKDDDVWAIVLKENNKVIGSIGLHNSRDKLEDTREIGYVLSEDHWGNGYCTEAVKEIIKYAFSLDEINLLRVCHFPFNVKSKRVIEKCGFIYEGTLRHASKIYDGRIYDSCKYSMTKAEYLNLLK
jgi:S-adenosylmethionine-dependent methyltransferase